MAVSFTFLFDYILIQLIVQQVCNNRDASERQFSKALNTNILGTWQSFFITASPLKLVTIQPHHPQLLCKYIDAKIWTWIYLACTKIVKYLFWGSPSNSITWKIEFNPKGSMRNFTRKTKESHAWVGKEKMELKPKYYVREDTDSNFWPLSSERHGTLQGRETHKNTKKEIHVEKWIKVFVLG